VVWLAQMVAVMPSILGDQSRIRTGWMWRWCRMTLPPWRWSLNPQAAAVLPVEALPTGGREAGRAVGAGLREGGVRPAGRPPAVVFHPVRDRVIDVGSMAMYKNTARRDRSRVATGTAVWPAARRSLDNRAPTRRSGRQSDCWPSPRQSAGADIMSARSVRELPLAARVAPAGQADGSEFAGEWRRTPGTVRRGRRFTRHRVAVV
jgi:hypothetical protein